MFGQLGELGFLGMTVPETYGGPGLDWLTYLLVLTGARLGGRRRGARRRRPQLAGRGVADPARDGEEQKRALLPQLASGARLGAFALAEPQAGSDADAITTAVAPDGEGWRLTGTKRWITNGQRAGLAVVFARSGAEGLDAYLVELPSPGWNVTARERTMGLRASETVTVELDRVRVPQGQLLGAPGQGMRLALDTYDVGRVGVDAQAVGIARAAREHAVGYALGREQFGQPIASFGGIAEKLAKMARRLTAARALAHGAAARLTGHREGAAPGSGPDSLTAWAAMAKLTGSEAAMLIMDEAVQVFGGYGYMRDYPVEKLMWDAKGTEIYEGTSEILRMMTARELLRDPATTDQGAS